MASESRIGNPTQQHGGGGMFAKGHVQGSTPYAPVHTMEAALDQMLPTWLTSPQKQAVKAWLSHDQAEIHQAAISHAEGAWAGTIDNLDEAIASGPVTSADQVVYREFPATDQLVPGMVLQSPGFMATSPHPISGTAAQIHVPAGSRALALPGEVLLPRGTQLQVQSAVAGHAPQMTIFTGATGDPPKVDPDDAPQRSYYRSLLTRAQNDTQRAAIMDAMRRVPGDQRP